MNQLILPAKYERLPQWQIRMAVLHAQSYVEDVLGITDESSPVYATKFHKEVLHFLEEGISESLTPHMDNPTTTIADVAFNEQPFFNIDGPFFAEHLKDKSQREKYYRLLRGNVNTLAFIYLDAANKIGKKDYAYPAGAKKGTTEFSAANIRRWKRLFVVSSIMALLEPLFRMNPAALDKFLEEKLQSKLALLQKPEERANFVNAIREQIVKEGFNAASIKKIL